MSDGIISMQVADVTVEVAPAEGGRLAQIRVGGRDLLQSDCTGNALTWGSYPMVPWAGRIREGRFCFDGRDRQLPVDMPSGAGTVHAIHGTGVRSAWDVVDAGRDYCDLHCELTWEFGGYAQQHLQLDAGGLTCVLGVVAVGRAMPAAIGWHPCFLKPESDELEFARMYGRDEHHINTVPLEPPRPRPWDDCFVEPLGPLRLHYPELTLTVTSDCDHWVVYDEQSDITCVEPQSGPNNAFNIGGATRLEPGDLLQRHMHLRWTRDR